MARETVGLKDWELEDSMALVLAGYLVRETVGLKDLELGKEMAVVSAD